MLAAVVLATSCATIPPEERYTVEEHFRADLDRYWIERQEGRRQARWSAITLVTATILGSVLVSGVGLGWYDEGVGNTGQIVSYGVVGASGLVYILGIRKWDRGNAAYIETLRLQSQYYNLIGADPCGCDE